MPNKTTVLGNKPYELIGKCNSNLCKTWCCHHIVVKVPIVNPDDHKYFEARNIQTTQLNNQELALLIPKTCKHLTPDGKCGIYHDRFTFCSEYAKRKTDWFSSAKCTTEWRELKGRKAQSILSKYRR